MPMQYFEARTHLGVSPAEAFAWHARPGALQRLQPPWEEVEVLEQSGGIRDGARVRLRARVGPGWTEWVVRHEGYEEGRRFCDVLERGPFAHWRHEHLFEAAGPAACTLIDRMEYRLPAGVPGRVLASGFVRRRLERLFRYRHAVTRSDLAGWKAWGDSGPRRILVSGATGLIGSALVPFLRTQGREVIALSRRSGPGMVQWDPAKGILDDGALAGVEAVVHLAGANVAGGRWTAERRREIEASRTGPTRLLIAALERAGARPAVWVNASAVGYYGDTGDASVTEESPPGPGFLADVCRAWEFEATRAHGVLGARTLLLRFAVVLSPSGGALAKMLPVFRAGCGGRLGGGRQWMSWVSLDDVLDVILRGLGDERLHGPVNVASPAAVRNAEFTRILAHVLERPAVIPVPRIALQAVFGRMAEETILSSARVEPARLLHGGHVFRHASLEEALRHVLGRCRA